MIVCCDPAFEAARIDAIKARIIALEGAITALAVGGVQSYSLDTGQTRQVVTRSDLSQLRLALRAAESDLATALARSGGCGRFNMVPGW